MTMSQQSSQPSQPLTLQLSSQQSLPQEQLSRPPCQAPPQAGNADIDLAIYNNNDDDDVDSFEYESIPSGSNSMGNEAVPSSVAIPAT
jgi:hypothetical protein